MTIERKIVFALNDIKSISYECANCGARATFPLGAELEPSAACYNCKNQWKPTQPNYLGRPEEISAFKAFLRSLNEIRTLGKEKVIGFKMVFELDELPASRVANDRV
jgi:hypothetical protein